MLQALGISVEFCAHVMHAFVVAPGTRQERMAVALTDVGASVLSGITLTKFVGEHLGQPQSSKGLIKLINVLDPSSWSTLHCCSMVNNTACVSDSPCPSCMRSLVTSQPCSCCRGPSQNSLCVLLYRGCGAGVCEDEDIRGVLL